MKVMTVKEVQSAFDLFIDTAQKEPVLVTKQERPIGVFLSIQEISNIPKLKNILLHSMGNKNKSPLLAMLGANKENPSFASVVEADQFMKTLQNEWQ